MVNIEPIFFPSIKEQEDAKLMNPNDLLLSMFNNITGPLLQESSSSTDSEAVNTEEFQSILRTILSKPATSTASNSTKQNNLDTAEGNEETKLSAEDLFPPASPSLSVLNPALASALSGMMNPKTDNSDIGPNQYPSFSSRPMRSVFNENVPISRRLSGPVKLEGPVVPLHLQRHAEGQLDLPSSHTVSYNGRQEEVPDEILCHLCNFPMKMCYRKSKYKQEIREYPAYRCLRKGCQTFRAIRKVLDEDALPHEVKRKTVDPNKTLKDLLAAPSMESRPPPAKIKKADNCNGTLVYIPFALNPEQVQRLQQAAKEIVTQDKLLEEGEVFIPPLMVATPLTEEELQEKLTTEEGIKEIKEELLSSKQLAEKSLTRSDSSPEQAVPC